MSRTVRLLRAAPITVPMLAVVGLLAAWAQADAGQPLTVWSPGALLVLALLGTAAVLVPNVWGDVPVPVRVAAILLALYTAWSFASIGWSDARGDAWEGANRTLLYLAVFCLFALWRQRPRTSAWVLTAWTLLLQALCLVALLRVAGAGDPSSLFVADRLDEPAGYPNAAAATWLIAVFPAIALAGAAPHLPWALRGVLAAGAVLCLDVALLSLSRGALFAMPIATLCFLAIVPGRLRSLAVLLVVAAAAAAAAPAVLDVGPAVVGDDRGDADIASTSMARTVLLCAALAGALVAAAFFWDSRREPSTRTDLRLRTAGRGLAVVALLALVVGGLAVAGNPVDRVENGWESFKGGYAEQSEGSRLTSGLGSNRYDFYRVALDVFADNPVAGTGADSFFQDYLVRGRSEETPRYAHSLQLRTLQTTGIVGALLLLGAFAAAGFAALRAVREAEPLAAVVAGGALMAFLYWAIHGSVDWFWEHAGLGAPAFAMLGLACALCPRREATARPRRLGTSGPEILAIVATIAFPCLSIAAPWMAEREVLAAAEVFDQRPFESYDRLDRARSLNPLSHRPSLVAGSIALRYGDLRRADTFFAEALERTPRDAYATLQRGALASARGDREGALGFLEEAVRIAPREPLARQSLAIVRQGDAVNIQNLSRQILVKAQQLSGG